MSIRSSAFFVSASNDIIINFTTTNISIGAPTFLIDIGIVFKTADISIDGKKFIIAFEPIHPMSGFFHF